MSTPRPRQRPLGDASLLTFSGLCRELAMSAETVQAFIDRHGIRPLRFGPGNRQVRYRWGDILEAAPYEGERDIAQGLELRHRTSGRKRVPL